jgi:hypothetical protein
MAETSTVIEASILIDVREAGGQFFIEVDAQGRAVVGPVVAVLQLREAGEDVLLGLRELARLLHAKVGHGQVEMDVRGVALQHATLYGESDRLAAYRVD